MDNPGADVALVAQVRGCAVQAGSVQSANRRGVVVARTTSSLTPISRVMAMDEAARLRRKRMNKEAALRSRIRKREHVESLQQEVVRLRAENQRLRCQLSTCQCGTTAGEEEAKSQTSEACDSVEVEDVLSDKSAVLVCPSLQSEDILDPRYRAFLNKMLFCS
ncbi:unnamed protein product (mitochondrion) [Plasmodiophora brassicae]|uniref:BZIP domain-containing protein n=1 Tax=Plasmodiophora brassicae TaxID=37360 RepID=A0A0G4J2Y4_PLABS|nr:hypothetical protein PBRA_002278 [Plasmodiophora brassicae]SPQ98867.1 unnamed protein product [Plasmodiophora brassicae]